MTHSYLHRKPKPWTAQEIELAEKLVDDKSVADIAIYRLLGRTRQACRDKLRRLRDDSAPGISRLKLFGQTMPITVPPDVIADRNTRLMAERDLTSTLMGDPPVGFSALERRP